ncbi:MAG: nitroreductase family protein [Acidimicrobiales bacterium]
MDLNVALRTTGSIREFSPDPVSEDVLYAVLDDARFAPSGGNRQAWRVIVVTGEQRRALAGIYLDAWHDYVAHVLAGRVPFSPLASDADRAAALAQRDEAIRRSDPTGFAETIDQVPAMLVVLADLGALAATDRDLARYQIVGGASVYPFVWSMLLSAHDHGLGGVMTTVLTRHEDQARRVLEVPDTFAIAALVALGYPRARHTRLKRRSVEAFTTRDSFSGQPFTRP